MQGSEPRECSSWWHFLRDWDFFALSAFLCLPYSPLRNRFASWFPAKIRLPSLLSSPRATRQHCHRQALGTKPADDDVAERDEFCPRKSCGTSFFFGTKMQRGALGGVREPVRTDRASPPNSTLRELALVACTSLAGSIYAMVSGKRYPSGLPLPSKELVVTFKAHHLNLIILQVPLR